MRLVVQLFLAVCYLFPTVALSENQQKLQKNDFTTWPGADIKEFGCFVEKEFGYKDKKFNCSIKQYVNKGDPCKNTVEYYEGLAFPKALSGKVNDKIDSIDLAWEHGHLQSVSIILKGKYTQKTLKESFKLPVEASIQECSKTNTCIILNGFDHMGAGDADCGEQQP